jgi:hypothetical protein
MKTKTPKKTEKKPESAERVIFVQTKRGSRKPEDRVSVLHVDIPDLWFGIEALERVAGEIRNDNHTKNVVIDGRAKTLDAVRAKAEKTWNAANDMLRCLVETVNPAVVEALGVLDALKAEAEVRRLEPADIQKAIDELSRALEDGLHHGR